MDGRARPLVVAAQTLEVVVQLSGDMVVHLGEVEAGEVVFGAGNILINLLAVT